MKKNFYLFIASSKRLINLSLIGTMFLLCGIVSQAQTYTLPFPTTPPANNDPSLDHNDHFDPPNVPEDAIEFGVKFRVTVPGFITGIRYYKHPLVGGTHTGHLWTNGNILTPGTLLASVNIPGAAGGWQEGAINFHVTPGNVYVASIFSGLGDYAIEPGSNTFTGATDFGTQPLIILGSANDPAGVGNGVYRYLTTSIPAEANGAFPYNNFQGSNYWVDVRFLPDFPLPVTLTDFRATVANKDVNLSWKTASETNNKGFEIQRSSNGREWSTINFVNGAGESTITKNYNYSDKNLAPGLYYYRLNQVDNDGKSKTSPVVTATIGGKGQVSLFTPNPLHGTGLIRFDLPRAQKARVSIFDLSGREIKVLSDNTREAGSHVVSIDAASLGRQLYFVRLRTEDGIVTKAILVD